MKTVDNIKERFGRMKMRKASKKLNRKVRSFSLDSASSIGIVYDATNRNVDEQVRKFVQYLKEERKEVTSLGFINSKDSSDIATPHLNYKYFDLSDLSKSNVPTSSELNQFINESFSILIDLSLGDTFPVEYISTLSRAKFKVGAQMGYRNEVCDLIIDVSQNITIDYLIIQVRHYLKMIKN